MVDVALTTWQPIGAHPVLADWLDPIGRELRRTDMSDRSLHSLNLFPFIVLPAY